MATATGLRAAASVIVVVALVAAVAGIGNIASASARKRGAQKFATIEVGLALSPPKVIFMGPYVAAQEGFFAKEHLRIHYISMPTGLETELGTTAGTINFGLSSGTDPIEAAASTAPVVAIGSYGEKLTTVCIVPPTIKKAKTLIGKPVGTTGATGFAYTTLNACLVAGGVHISQVKPIDMTRAEFVSAIDTHRIYAAAFHADTGYVVLHSLKGSHVLYQEYKAVPTWWYGAISVKRAYARSHKSITERFLAALILADRWMNAKKNTSKLITIAVTATTETVNAVTYAVKLELKSHTWSTTLALEPKRIGYTVNELLKLKEITHKPPLKKIATTSYLKGALELLKKQHLAKGY